MCPARGGLNRRWQGTDLVAGRSDRGGLRHRSGMDIEGFAAQNPERRCKISEALQRNLTWKRATITPKGRNSQRGTTALSARKKKKAFRLVEVAKVPFMKKVVMMRLCPENFAVVPGSGWQLFANRQDIP